MRIPLLLAAAVLCAACGESEASGSATESLDGREFVSTAVTGHRLVAGSQIRLNFDGDRLGVSAGCNQLGGTWSIDDNAALVVPDDMAMTEMACDPPALMDQDTWLATFLTSRPTVARDGETLTLTGGDVTITLLDREVADPDRPLEGTKWTVDGLVAADAVSSVPSDVRVPTVRFDGGQVSVDTGCNTGSGDHEATAAEITFGPITTTLIGCDEPAASVEAHVVGVLHGTVTYQIEAGTLTLTNGDQGLVLRAAD
jgi:heat shock protein HslJ